MTAQAAKILHDALGLPEEDRASLIARLLESLDDPPESGAEDAWREEVGRRLDEVEKGQVETIPWPEVKRRLLS